MKKIILIFGLFISIITLSSCDFDFSSLPTITTTNDVIGTVHIFSLGKCVQYTNHFTSYTCHYFETTDFGEIATCDFIYINDKCPICDI